MESKLLVFNESPKEKVNRVARDKAIIKKKENKQVKRVFTTRDAISKLTPEMQDIMQHKASDIYMITGKEFGKGYAIGLKMISYMEMDIRANGFAMKKYKTNAAERLHTTFANLANEIKMEGFTIPNYEKGQSKTYRMKNKVKPNNQSIEFASFEDYNSMTGAEAYNLGYFPVVFFDEPSQMDDDPDKIPTKEKWDLKINAMKSSISRSNTRHMTTFKRQVQSTQYYYALNPWDDHPIILEAEKVFPEKEFMSYVIDDLLNNHTMYRYDEESDKLYVRGTKFGNPVINIFEKMCVSNNIKSIIDFETKKGTIDYSDKLCEKYYVNDLTLKEHLKRLNGIPLYIQAQKAINQRDNAKLAEILGMKYIGESKFKPTYDITNLKLMDTKEVLKNMDESSTQIIGWDIDQKKGGRFVGTPMWLAYKTYKGKTYKNIIIGRQEIINSRGVSESGIQLPIYIDKMSNAIKDMESSFRTKTQKESLAILDDNGRHYIYAITNKLPGIRITSSKFKTQKKWVITKRQTLFQTAIDFGYLICDKSNTMLLRDLKMSVCKNGDKQRDESGGKALLYDTINSMEYALFYLRGEIIATHPPGEIDIYMSKEITNE